MILQNSEKLFRNLYKPTMVWHYGYLQRKYANQWIDTQLNYYVGRNKKVLDYGCGNSPQKGKIQSLSGEYSGVDVKKTNFGSVFNGTNLPFKSALFDIVLLNEVIYAILDGPKAISECYRVLKPGGTLIVSANFLYPLQGDPTQFELGFAKDHFRFTESGLKELLSLHFKKITVDQLGGLGSQLLLPQYFYRNHLMRHPNKAVKFVFTFLFPAFLVACATLNLLGILLNSLDSSKLFATDVVAIAKK